MRWSLPSQCLRFASRSPVVRPAVVRRGGGGWAAVRAGCGVRVGGGGRRCEPEARCGG